MPEVLVEHSCLRDDLEVLLCGVRLLRERDVLRLRYGLDDGRARTLEEGRPTPPRPPTGSARPPRASY